jgi:hypothetical protein
LTASILPVIISKDAAITKYSFVSIAFAFCSVVYAVIAFILREKGNLFTAGYRFWRFVDYLFAKPESYTKTEDYKKEFGTYKLQFPNREVKEGFIKFLLPYYTKRQKAGSFKLDNFVIDLRNGKAESFMVRMQSLFADTPYLLIQGGDRERHYHNVIYLLTRLMGFYVKAEYQTSAGRIDMVIETDDYVYVMEFKLDGTAEEALLQIEERGYAQPFMSSGKKLFKIGVNFSSETKSIDRWIIKE